MHLRVMTLNPQNTEGPPRRQQVLNDVLRRFAPDLLALQDVATTSSWRLDAEAARERLALALADLDARHRRTLRW